MRGAMVIPNSSAEVGAAVGRCEGGCGAAATSRLSGEHAVPAVRGQAHAAAAALTLVADLVFLLHPVIRRGSGQWAREEEHVHCAHGAVRRRALSLPTAACIDSAIQHPLAST